MPPIIVSIISKKGSGKTTLIEKLIPILIRRGFKVGTVKHDIHGFDIDHEGKDTWRHKQSGAQAVVISSPRKIALVRDIERELDLDDIVARYFDGIDIVLTEGYRQANKPQIEVFRKAVHRTPHHTTPTDTLLAVVADSPVDLGVPCLGLDEIERLADLMIEKLL